MMMTRQLGGYLWLLFLLLTVLGQVNTVEAHNPDQSYVYIRVYEDSLSGRFEATFEDLNRNLGLELKNESEVKDIRAQLPAIQKYALENTTFRSSYGEHKIVFEEPRILHQGSLGDFLQLNFRLENTARVPAELEIEYGMFFEKDPNHRGLVLIEYNWKDGIYGNEAIHSLVISPGSKKQTLSLTKGGSVFQGFIAMIGLGIWHIWIGLDHILFLLALVFPSVLVLNALRDQNEIALAENTGHWSPAEKFGPAAIKVLKIVTAFTIAHTITLSLAALDIVVLPSRFVESIIALSIALAAIHNIWPVVVRKEWVIAFAFGLFHGFGFAGILAEKGFGGEFLVLTLLGFNLGVELGQVAIIAIMFPALFILRKTKLYPTLLIGGSVFLVFVSLYWFIERAFEIDLPLGGIILRALGIL